jgi:uncharacterized protein YaiI (UPF0178 family)
MPAEIVSLSHFRKQKERAEKEHQAQTNRVKHGRTKGEKLSDQKDRERFDNRLSGREFDDDPEPA